jgi:hypothetical protein
VAFRVKFFRASTSSTALSHSMFRLSGHSM